MRLSFPSSLMLYFIKLVGGGGSVSGSGIGMLLSCSFSFLILFSVGSSMLGLVCLDWAVVM